MALLSHFSVDIIVKKTIGAMWSKLDKSCNLGYI